ncbi:hypothetical protein [Nocardia abscessus]|uniref:hypothetical protein n=1 Tax=Nocardia abscessus TaxID=120957 RepID=UPI00245791D6|nr:hypothetical protein [Nocardia abscessus]
MTSKDHSLLPSPLRVHVQLLEALSSLLRAFTQSLRLLKENVSVGCESLKARSGGRFPSPAAATPAPKNVAAIAMTPTANFLRIFPPLDATTIVSDIVHL